MLELREGLYSNLPHYAAEILQQRMPGAVQQREAVLHGYAGQRMPGMRDADPAERRSRAPAEALRKTLPANAAGSCTIIRNGRKSSRRIINRPFRSARIAEKTFSQNGVPAHSAASAATLAVSSGGQITGKQIHPWRKSPCGANAAGRRCARIRKSIAAVPAISEPWKKHTVSRYARGAEKNFQSMQVKNASIAAGTAPAPHRLRQRIFAEASEGFSIQNRKAGQSISSRPRGKRNWTATAGASGLYAERPACTQGLTA